MDVHFRSVVNINNSNNNTMAKPNNRTRSTVRAAEKDDNASSTPTIFRRFPRLGSAFQTKLPRMLPDDSYQPSRQSAVLLSKEHPDVAQSDIMNDFMDYSGECQVALSFFVGSSRWRESLRRATVKTTGIMAREACLEAKRLIWVYLRRTTCVL